MRETARLEDGKQPRVLSQTPGRVRIHLPAWDDEPSRMEARLRQVHGVETAQANPLTGNVLVRFNPRMIDLLQLLAALPQRPDPESSTADPGPGASGGLNGEGAEGPDHLGSPWLRVGARGLVGHAVVDALWFGAGFLGRRLGLPLAGLGPLHLLLDIFVWGAAFTSVAPKSALRSPSADRTGSDRGAIVRWERAR